MPLLSQLLSVRVHKLRLSIKAAMKPPSAVVVVELQHGELKRQLRLGVEALGGPLMTKYQSFGSFIRERRIENGTTLRSFCKVVGLDTAYVSRLENDLIPAPQAKERLDQFAAALGIPESGPERQEMFDLASASRRSIPSDIDLSSPRALELLPAFYRTLRNQSISEEEAQQLLRMLIGNAEGDG